MDPGSIIPLLGRTQYRRGAVVFTLKHTFLSDGFRNLRFVVTTSVKGPLNLRSEGGSRTRICSCFAMAPEADAIGDSAERGRARGGGSLAGAWGGGRTTVAAPARPSSRTGPGSRVPEAPRLLLGRGIRGPPVGSAAPGVTTDSTLHQPPRPRALRSSAPHVTSPTCRRARLRGPEP